ncbi:hypothetical protein Avbf_17383 [Armadillidium vulgare]|nr:hypothetical protein Avbf_17383 [Armadillidium vulgare]
MKCILNIILQQFSATEAGCFTVNRIQGQVPLTESRSLLYCESSPDFCYTIELSKTRILH